jgi:hypothetical protein
VSFFDDVDDEPPTQPAQRRRRTSGPARRPPGGRPPSVEQAILVRRIVAVGIVVVFLVLVVVGVRACQSSATKSALKDYNNNVSALIDRSDDTGAQLFKVLSSGSTAGGAVNLQSQIAEALSTAKQQLSQAKKFDVPDQVKDAQRNLLQALQMRSDGIANIGQQIQPALSNATAKDAVNSIATETARLYASDVIYKDYTVPLIAGALKANGIAIGGSDGQTLNSGQFVPSLQWVQPTFIAQELRVSITPPGSKPSPGLHGHSLDSVSVGGTTLQTGSTNTVSATPPPTFTLSFTNGGTNTEHNISCKVTVSGSSISGHQTVAQTTPGQHASCAVTLNSSPPTGNYQVTAAIGKVPGEKNTQNNTMTFPVTFQ